MSEPSETENFEATLEQYIDRFKKPPLMVYGITSEALCELMQEALKLGRPIPEKGYYRHLPPGALA